MSNSVPGAEWATGTYAMPMAFLRNGVWVPLVTRPAAAPPMITG